MRHRCISDRVNRSGAAALLALIAAPLLPAACQGDDSAAAVTAIRPVRVIENPQWTAIDPGVAPRAVVREREVDFGRVPLDTPIEYRATWRNAGGQPLLIVGAPFANLLYGC